MNIIGTQNFHRELKPLVKKYPSLKSDLLELDTTLKENPSSGVYLGKNCYKIRIAITSKGRGKSGGGRVITYFHLGEEDVYLLSIYDKSEKENIPDHELNALLKEAGLSPEE